MSTSAMHRQAITLVAVAALGCLACGGGSPGAVSTNNDPDHPRGGSSVDDRDEREPRAGGSAGSTGGGAGTTGTDAGSATAGDARGAAGAAGGDPMLGGGEDIGAFAPWCPTLEPSQVYFHVQMSPPAGGAMLVLSSVEAPNTWCPGFHQFTRACQLTNDAELVYHDYEFADDPARDLVQYVPDRWFWSDALWNAEWGIRRVEANDPAHPHPCSGHVREMWAAPEPGEMLYECLDEGIMRWADGTPAAGLPLEPTIFVAGVGFDRHVYYSTQRDPIDRSDVGLHVYHAGASQRIVPSDHGLDCNSGCPIAHVRAVPTGVWALVLEDSISIYFPARWALWHFGPDGHAKRIGYYAARPDVPDLSSLAEGDGAAALDGEAVMYEVLPSRALPSTVLRRPLLPRTSEVVVEYPMNPPAPAFGELPPPQETSGCVVTGPSADGLAAPILSGPTAEDDFELGFNAVAAEYAPATNVIVALDAVGATLYIVDVAGEAVTELPLPDAGTAVSIQPDGLRAAVTHRRGVSIVDVDAGLIEQTISWENNTLRDVSGQAELPGNGYVYVIGVGSNETLAIELATGVETARTIAFSGDRGIAAVHPGGGKIYATYRGTTGEPLQRLYFDGPTISYTYPDDYHSYGDRICDNFWISEDGTRLLTQCGRVFAMTDDPLSEADFIGTLQDVDYPLRHVNHSSEAAATAALMDVDQARQYDSAIADKIWLYAEDRSLMSQLDVPVYRAVSWPSPARGQFVFFSADGSQLHLVYARATLAQAPGGSRLHTYDLP